VLTGLRLENIALIERLDLAFQAGFTVLTENGPLPKQSMNPTFSQLSFYKPAIEHDTNITNNVCEKRIAMLGVSISN
jgi:hypothetical protein